MLRIHQARFQLELNSFTEAKAAAEANGAMKRIPTAAAGIGTMAAATFSVGQMNHNSTPGLVRLKMPPLFFGLTDNISLQFVIVISKTDLPDGVGERW